MHFSSMERVASVPIKVDLVQFFLTTPHFNSPTLPAAFFLWKIEQREL